MWLTLAMKFIGGKIMSGVRFLIDRPVIAVALIAAIFAFLYVHQKGETQHQSKLKDLARAETKKVRGDFDNFKLDVIAETKKATLAQIAVTEAQRATYSANKEKADVEYQNSLEGTRSGFERMLAANRVSAKACRGEGRSTDPAAQGPDTGLPETMPESTIMVAEAELRALNDWALIGIGASNWVNGLIEAGVAE